MTERQSLIVSTTHGKLAGVEAGGVRYFRGIPYAAPPTGKLRFRPPEPHRGWTGVRPAHAQAPIPPQMPSRLRNVLGDYALPQSEDCLTLDITTPSLGRNNGSAPVLVWLYGGAFVTGGTAVPWYDGTSFARRHGIVFVSLNYRLGALGFLSHPELGPGNAGLHDQFTALQWVKENIAEFGGDPDKITLAGQSAGAISIFALLATSGTAPLFRQAILQSGRFNSLSPKAQMESVGEAFLHRAGMSANALRNLPVAEIVTLQTAFIRENAEFAVTSTPFRPGIDEEFVPNNPLQAAISGAKDKPLILGWTHDELLAFFAHDPAVRKATPDQINGALRRHWDDNWREAYSFARARAPGASIEQLLALAVNEATFAGATVAFAESLADANNAPWLYRFDWSAPENPVQACHCVELPFVFNNTAKWQPPMHEGANLRKRRALAQVVHDTWASFVDKHNPNHTDLPVWSRYELQSRRTLRIGIIIESVSDLAGVADRTRARPARISLANR